MLLVEVVDEQKFYEMCWNTLSQAVTGSGHSADKTLNVVVSTLLRRFPNLRYSGTMFRVAFIPIKQFLQFKNNTDALNAIKHYKYKDEFPTGHDYGASRIYQSWATTAKGLNKFMKMSRNYGSDDYNPHWNETVQIGTILSQHGIGLNVGAALKMLAQQLKKDNAYSVAGEVGEILAALEQNVDIKLYHVIGVGDAVYSPNDLKDVNPNEFDGDPRLHRYEKDFQVLPSQFPLLKQRLQHEYQTNTPSRGKGQKKHPDSQMKRIKRNQLDIE